MINKSHLPLLISGFLTLFNFSAHSQADCISLARDYFRNGDYHLVVETLTNCDGETKTPAHSELLASGAFLSGNLSLANGVINEIPDSVFTQSLWSLKARIAFATGDYESSRVAYLKLMETDSQNVNYVRQLAFAYDKLDSTLQAINNWERAMVLNPADVVSGMKLVEKYFYLDRFEEADSLAATLLNHNPLPDLFRLRGDILYAMKEHAEAYECFVPLLRKGTSNPELLRKAGICKFINGDTEMAVQMLSVAHLIKPDDEITCYYLAMSYQSMKDYKGSELFFKAAINNAISQNMGNYYIRMGEMFETSGNYVKALESYQTAINYTEGKPELHHEVGRVYEVYFQDRKNALMNYRKYLELASDTTTHQYRGVKNRIEGWEK